MTKERENTLFSEKSIKRTRVITILKLLGQLVINISLIIVFNALDVIFAGLVPSKEEWTLVIMVIPLSLFGIYTSLFSSNHQNHRDEVVCGKSYNEIRKSAFKNSLTLDTFRVNIISVSLMFAIYLLTVNYPMIVGTSLVLCIDLPVFILFELNHSKKSLAVLYKEQFSLFFKSIDFKVFFSKEDLSKVEELLKSNRWAEINEMVVQKCEIEDFFDIFSQELTALPHAVASEVISAFVNSCSFAPKHVENHLVYKYCIDRSIVLADKIRQNGDELCADKLLICLGEQWVHNLISFFSFETDSIKLNRKKSNKLKAFLNALKDSMKMRLLHDVFLEEYTTIMDKIKKLKHFSNRRKQLVINSNLIADTLATINKKHDDFVMQIITDSVESIKTNC